MIARGEVARRGVAVLAVTATDQSATVSRIDLDVRSMTEAATR